MNNNSNVKKMVYVALLIALAIVIPVYFSFLRINIPPFTATITAHVPMFISMFLGPGAAIMVGIGSVIGFFITSPAVVAARAAAHILVGAIGAILLRKNVSFAKVIAITAPIHGGLEALAVIPFGFTMFKVLVVVGFGSMIHHSIDGIIALALIKSLSKALKYNLAGEFLGK